MNAQPVVKEVCTVCGRPGATLNRGGAYLCATGPCRHAHPPFGETAHKDKDKDEDKAGGNGNGSSALTLVPSPCVDFEEPELYGLVRDYDAGLLKPIDVELGELPESATEPMRRVAADIQLLLGLRLAVSEDRPLPYSTRLCAERCELRDHREASRVLAQLEQAGVVKCAGAMKPRGMPFGTKLYRAPG